MLVRDRLKCRLLTTFLLTDPTRQAGVSTGDVRRMPVVLKRYRVAAGSARTIHDYLRPPRLPSLPRFFHPSRLFSIARPLLFHDSAMDRNRTPRFLQRNRYWNRARKFTHHGSTHGFRNRGCHPMVGIAIARKRTNYIRSNLRRTPLAPPWSYGWRQLGI